MKKTNPILISNNEVVVFYDTLSEDKKKEIVLILAAHNFNTNLLERTKVFKVPRFLLLNNKKVDMAKIIGSGIGIYSLHEQSKRIVPTYHEKLSSINILRHSTSFALFLNENRQEIISILMNYETYHVANDEIDRAIDLFENLNENSNYYQRRIGNIVTFLPRNQPLYALSCFALVLSYMSRRVFVHVPSTMRFFFPLIEKRLDLKNFFPNLTISYKPRRDLLDNSSTLMYEESLACWRPTTDVVIFTGTTENAKKVRGYFENSTLFIANGAGHNPVIITSTADLEKATDAVLELQLYNQGQDCANPSSIIVHHLVYDNFVRIILDKLKRIRVGPYSDKSCVVGPITKLSDLEKIQRILIDNKKWIHSETPGTIHIATRIVEPTLIVKPLRDGGNYKEQLSPVFFVQKYEDDADIKLYFENPRYWQNAMYVTIYGESSYIKKLLDYRMPNGNILHDDSTVIRDTHLHARGVERGVKPYGGYGRGSSWLSINNHIIIKPTLPQRDIFEQIVAPSIELERIENLKENNTPFINTTSIKFMEKIPTDNEQLKSEKIPKLETNNRILNISEQGWINEVTEKVLEIFPAREEYTCASGISPSGIVHFGNFRDVMTSFEIFKNLEKQNKNARLLFSWDDFDRFRKVPANVDPSFSQYIGLPLSAVPDPTGKTESYAKCLEEEFEKSMNDLGIKVEYRYQTQEYKSGRYDDLIIQAIQSRDRIAEILLSFMSDKGKEERQIDPEKFKEEYYPISVYSRFTGKDNTKIIDYDGDSKITYLCLDTKQQETIDLRKEHVAKLSWKIDWPMRWKKEGVVFEPGGHDHAAPQGSYNAASVIAKEVFDIEPPVFMEYKFIGIRGLKEKMSGSKGNAITPAELLHIYEPDLLKWIYLRKNPHQTFELAFDTEIYRQYDEYDRAVIDFFEKKENSAYARSLAFIDDIDQPKYKNPIPFRQAVAYGQILQWNKEKVMEILNKLGLVYDPTSVEERLSKAKSWLEEYNPEEIIKLRDTINKEYADLMTEDAKNFVRKLRSFLLNTDTKVVSVEEIEKVIYHIPRVTTLPPAELKKAQRVFFKDIYNLLISKDTGPRLPTFIWAVDKKQLLDLLDI